MSPPPRPPAGARCPRSPSRAWAIAAASAIAAAMLAAPPCAFARARLDVALPLQQVFGAALRFVRVDRGCKVTDKDADAAYITFECPGDDDKTVKRGAMELIPEAAQRRGGVRAQVTLSDEPHYVELRFLELFERKLRDERGGAPPRPAPEPAPAPPAVPDGGSR